MSKPEKVFLWINVLVWIPYSLYLIFDPTLLAGLGVFPQTDWVQKVEVRAMYGGAQLAVGLFALVAILKPEHKDSAILFLVLLFGGLALVRIAGLVIDGPGLGLDTADFGSPATYNSGALWLFEVPLLVFGAYLYITGSNAKPGS